MANTANDSEDFQGHTLSKGAKLLLASCALLLVALGQPAWCWWCGLLAAIFGYALFWRVLLCYPQRSTRFWMSTAWFFLVQVVQLSWAVAHPYWYIYAIYFLTCLIIGLQFGVIGIFITTQSLTRFTSILGLSALWTLFEWSRLFILSGFSWNPIGIALTGSIYSLQLASLWGVFGLSFWIMFVNFLSLRAWQFHRSIFSILVWGAAALFPYFYGVSHLQIHSQAVAERSKEKGFDALLVQTTFPIEEEMGFFDNKALTAYIIGEWRQILSVTKRHLGKSIDLMVLPEYAVPGGTWTFIFPYEAVKTAFKEILGPESLKHLPPLQEPFARRLGALNSETYLVNNAFWAQGIANCFQTGVVVGLEDAQDFENGPREHYSAAQYFSPSDHNTQKHTVQRYEKRVLVPLGEYLPFSFFRDIVAKYGIQGSFTPGTGAKVFNSKNLPFGLSICYEETFGNLMRENKHLGAGILVNLTNDVWYAKSRLAHQHFSHSRLRTVENGFPLIRATNFGLSCAVDSFGQLIGLVGEGTEQPDQFFDALLVKVPIYTYQTVYSHFGDSLIIGISLVLAALFLFISYRDQ